MMRIATAALVLVLAAPPAGAYVEAMYPLQQVLNESEVIAVGEIEKVDAKNKVAIIKVSKSLKGKCGYAQIRMNIGGGQDWHPDAIMRHFVVGAPAMVFYNQGRQAEGYINRFFFQLYGDAAAAPEKAWWNFTHIEIRMNRTFNGTVKELEEAVTEILAGKRKAPAPNSKIPSITRNDVKALPAHGEEPKEAGGLPISFLKPDPTKRPAPREPENPAGAVKGLKYEYYEGTWNELPDFDALKPVETGTAETIDLSKCKRQEQIGLRFTGFLEIPKDGDWTFFTVSDDGSKLFVGKTEVVSNDGLHPPVEAAGDLPLKAGKHAFTLTFFENSGGEVLQLFWQGPGVEKQAVPASAFFRAGP